MNAETWLDDHGDCLYGFALLRVRKPEVAEDLVQETLLAGIRSQERFERKSQIRTWLVGILKNKIYDYFRKLGRETSFTDLQFLEHEQNDRFQDGYWIHDHGPNAWDFERSIDREEFWTTMRSCLSKLPPRVGDVFMLREVDQQSTREICSTLSISPSNLWVMLHRARMSLRDCLEMNWFKEIQRSDKHA